MGVRIPPPLPGICEDTDLKVRAGETVMATRAVKMNDESQSGSNLPLVNKVTGTIESSREFLHDVRVEMKQVTWPNREDVISTTGVVIATVAFFGVFLAIVEYVAQHGLEALLHFFKV